MWIEPELILKTTVPRRPKTALQRARLSIESQTLTTKMALSVYAPAGYGKTWLLTQWRRELLSRGSVVAWLTLDGRDDNLRFVRGLTAAFVIASGKPAFFNVISQAMGGGDGLGELTQWLAKVADFGGEVALLLDGADALPETTLDSALAYLLHNAPANLRILMTSRKRLSLRASELQARGLFLSISLEALRFRVEETIEVFGKRFANRIDIDLMVQVHELTEGWPLGVQLAVAAIEGSADPRVAIEELKTCSGDIQHYFIDRLLAQLSEEQSEFLIRIAMLDRLHPELCAAVTGKPQAAGLLATLCATTPIFTEVLDNDWVRIHPLARVFLRQRLAGSALELRRELHLRAASWLESYGLSEEAARQYLLADRPTQAYEMIERCLYQIMLRGHFNRVIEWTQALPEAVIRSRPRMCLAAAWALAMGEHSKQAAGFIQQIQSASSSDQDVCCEADAIASTVAYFSDQPDESLAIIARWTGPPATVSVKVQAILANQHARLALFRGQTQAARRIYRRAPQYTWTQGLDTIRGYGEWIVGMTYVWEGWMLPAEEALRASLLRADQDIGRRSAMATLLAGTLAAVLLERNKVQEATTLLAHRLDVVEQMASPEAIICGFLTASRLAGLQAQAHRSYDLLQALFALGEERAIPRLCIASLGEQIHLHARQGRGDTCLTLWRRLQEVISANGDEPQNLLEPELELYAGFARAYMLMSQGDWAGVLKISTALQELACSLRRGRERVQSQLLKALALQEMGENGEDQLLEATSLAEEYGLCRVLLDTHPRLSNWLEQLNGGAPPQYFSSPHSPLLVSLERSPAVFPSGLLTPKEQQVLQLLARNLSNKQIALAQDVGEETVKWHLKNLFGKFRVGTRKHVVERARMLGILDAG